MEIKIHKEGNYWYIPESFFIPGGDESKLLKIYRSALGQVWMKKYNKSYNELMTQYLGGRPLCPYCGSPRSINPSADGVHAQFKSDKYYLPTCSSDSCIEKLNSTRYRTQPVLAQLSKINSSPNRSDYIARSSMSRLINKGGTGTLYLALLHTGRIKFGATTMDLISRKHAFNPVPYSSIKSLVRGPIKSIALMEYELKKTNNWSELIEDWELFKSEFRRVKYMIFDDI